MSVIGYCSICDGEVELNRFAIPTCIKCGAQPKKKLPVIEMNESDNKQLLQE